MEELLNMWTSELTKQTNEFHKKAAQVSEWDRQLIVNGSAINELYGSVNQVEVSLSEINNTMHLVDRHQDELSRVLDDYEKQLQNAMESGFIQQSLLPADQTRENAYGVAESINSQLDDVNRNLNVMIDEINEMGVSSKPESADDDKEDGIGKVAKILNSQLSSLQWIDKASSELQTKLQEAHRIQEKVIQNQSSFRRD
ncbi:hypothetical protein PHYBLDRAFT_160236 [Phycomyces blakesleeanus NRRL 1555(-)]|uniref:Nucleoporin NSP1-like C-terminal domain-containing protein n=2 Tax=Phycomyces blakesleeanus TaxID=4837 RepID=A0A162TF75_PHYB8|nr:hypothetical protein PHYBLDRAFT_160236 [Phycomyces blakesleeanus NRRL 1555(-)]OAD68112.1 hypothetical protein PHYBLDRAFT_160236 [Phycomyces blakesleeanus NRRL 1555(-)]|eukprot:XP_018286152.1 hypothetical protein PHYBLDRAFT_160236 [Phycomyces blakesleeanus NRRL 1555(-)]